MHNADLVTDTNNRVICDISMDIFFVCQNSSVQCPQENNRYLSIPKLKFRIFACSTQLLLVGWCERKKTYAGILKYHSSQSQEKYFVL